MGDELDAWEERCVRLTMNSQPLLRASSTKKIVVISTGGADPRGVRALGLGDIVAYSMTKTAAHMATVKWAIKLKDEGFIVVSLTPGLVDTTGTIGEHGMFSC